MRSRGVDGAIFRSSVTTAGGCADWPKRLWCGSGGSRACVEGERVVRSRTTTTTTTCGSLLAATGVVACGGGLGRRGERDAMQYASKRPRHALCQTERASKGDDTGGRASREGPGRRGGMITGGQKQTSDWAANNTREQGGGRRVAAEGGGGVDGDGDDGTAAGEMAGIRSSGSSSSSERRCRGWLRAWFEHSASQRKAQYGRRRATFA